MMLFKGDLSSHMIRVRDMILVCSAEGQLAVCFRPQYRYSAAVP